MRSNTRTNLCKVCFKPINDSSIHCLVHSNMHICYKCFSECVPIFHEFKIDNCSGLALYKYDEYIRSKLYQLKGCGDIELASIFFDYYRFLRFKYLGYVVIGAPFSENGTKRRGFEQNIEIYKTIGLNVTHPIRKRFDFKQSDCSKKERENIFNKLTLDKRANLKGRKVLIVDDVMTTGSTIRAMIKILRAAKVKKIKVLVMSYVDKTIPSNSSA